MRVLVTPMKKRPSNRASRDRRARSHANRSSSTPCSLTRRRGDDAPKTDLVSRPAAALRSSVAAASFAHGGAHVGACDTGFMHAISRFPIPALGTLPEDIRARIVAVHEKAGFIPNVFLAWAHRPDEFRAFFAYHDALLEKEGGLTKAEREMIVVATSSVNQCQYCVIAHGAILRVYAKNPRVADQVAVNYREAEITPRQKAMLAFALKIARESVTIDDADFDALHKHGFGDEDIWDIGAIASFFALSNRMAHLTRMRPNDEFYLLGRVPKGG